MHIPDGFLSTQVSWAFWLVSAAVISVALIRVNKDLGEREVPLMGVLAAAIFAGQMLNFTVAGGTSGHLMGAALASILLGPWAAVLVMTAVVSVQALIFQDGGLVVLGANLFNMAVIAPFVSYFVYKLALLIGKKTRAGVYAGSFISAWMSIVVTSLSVALQLALSGTSPANISVPAMGGIHMLIGIGEGLITLGAISFIYSARLDLLKIGAPQPGGNRWVLVGGLAMILLLAVLTPLASSHPDGLEKVAEQAGFLDTAQAPSYAIIPDYLFPGISNESAATVTAAIIGALIVLGVSLLVAYTRRKKVEA